MGADIGPFFSAAIEKMAASQKTLGESTRIEEFRRMSVPSNSPAMAEKHLLATLQLQEIIKSYFSVVFRHGLPAN